MTHALSVFSLGVFGTLISILWNLKSEKIKHEFPVTFIVNTKTRMPYSSLEHRNLLYYDALIPSRTPASNLAEFALKSKQPQKPPSATELYHQILTRQIIDILSYLFRRSWDSQIRRYRLPFEAAEFAGAHPDRKSLATDVYQRDVFSQFFPEFSVLRYQAFSPQISFPAGTEISGIQDKHEIRLVFQNKFVRVQISSEFISGMVGLLGMREILDLTEEESKKYEYITYTVSLSAKFVEHKSGHPHMEAYKNWVNLMFGEIQNALDSEKKWEKVSEAAFER